MASLQQFPSGNYHITIQFGGRRYKRSLKTKSRRQALSMKARAEETVRLVESGRIEVPEAIDIPTFLLSDGKLSAKPIANEARLADLFDQFFESLPPGSLEPETIRMMQIHRRHVEKHFGSRFSLRLLSFNDLQKYVNTRASVRGVPYHTLTPAK